MPRLAAASISSTELRLPGTPKMYSMPASASVAATTSAYVGMGSAYAKRALLRPLAPRRPSPAGRWPGALAHPRYEVGAPGDPRGHRLDRAAASRDHEYVALHRAAREVHRARVGPSQGLVVTLGPDADHELVLDDSAEHLAAAEEGEATKHLLLRNVSPALKGASDALNEILVVRHRRCLRRTRVRDLSAAEFVHLALLAHNPSSLSRAGPNLAPADVVEDGGDRLGVLDLAGVDAGERLVEAQRYDLHLLILVSLGVFGRQLRGEEGVDVLGAEAGRGEEAGEALALRRGEAGFLGQLAAGRSLGRLAVLEGAGRQLEEVAADGVAVLPDPEDAPLVVDGNDDDGAGVVDHLAADVAAGGDLDLVDAQADDAALVDRLAADEDGEGPVGMGGVGSHLLPQIMPPPSGGGVVLHPSLKAGASAPSEASNEYAMLALLQLSHQGDLVAAGELRAAVALVPDLARQGHDVGLDEAEPLEEGGAVGEGEDALEADAPRLVHRRVDEQRADAPRLRVLGHGVRFHLAEVGPDDVEGDAAEEAVGIADDDEVAQVLVDLAHGAREHVAALGVEVDQVVDRLGVGDVGLARPVVLRHDQDTMIALSAREMRDMAT